MALNPPHTDFVLPGLQSPKKQYALEAAYSFAFSKLSNRRNLENPWYAFWGQISDALADHDSLLSISQFCIWFKTGVEVTSDTDEDPGNTSLETNTSYTSTVPEKNTKAVAPDFTVIHLDLRERGVTVNDTRLGRTLKLRGLRIALVFENKRGGKRVRGGAEFPLTFLSAAKFQGMEQAMHVFKMFPEQTHIIAIATAGHWWAFRSITRPEDADFAIWAANAYTSRKRRKNERKGRKLRSSVLRGLEEETDEEAEDEDEEAKDGDDEPEDEDDEPEGKDDEDEESDSENEDTDPDDDSDGPPPHPPHIQTQIAALADTVEELAPPSIEWSLAFEFGTPQSSQRLWYLNSYLASFYNQG